jgi:hypothetical protein
MIEKILVTAEGRDQDLAVLRRDVHGADGGDLSARDLALAASPRIALTACLHRSWKRASIAGALSYSL